MHAVHNFTVVNEFLEAHINAVLSVEGTLIYSAAVENAALEMWE